MRDNDVVVVVVEGTPENPKIDEFQNRDGDAMLHCKVLMVTSPKLM